MQNNNSFRSIGNSYKLFALPFLKELERTGTEYSQMTSSLSFLYTHMMSWSTMFCPLSGAGQFYNENLTKIVVNPHWGLPIRQVPWQVEHMNLLTQINKMKIKRKGTLVYRNIPMSPAPPFSTHSPLPSHSQQARHHRPVQQNFGQCINHQRNNSSKNLKARIYRKPQTHWQIYQVCL